MSAATPCPVCGISPESKCGALIAEDEFSENSWARVRAIAYPGGGFTLCIQGEEDSERPIADAFRLELPLNFCPECGRDLRNPDGKRGEWIDTGDGGTHCSECGYDAGNNLTPFCPKCGARMDGA